MLPGVVLLFIYLLEFYFNFLNFSCIFPQVSFIHLFKDIVYLYISLESILNKLAFSAKFRSLDFTYFLQNCPSVRLDLVKL